MSTNNELKFYTRQVKLIGSDGQESLSRARVLVIGAGGLGCPVLLYLAAMGVGSIGIIDHDTVDITNLHRQILYTPADIGKFKAEIATNRISAQNPHIKVACYTSKLNQINIKDYFNDYDIIVDCTDNFTTKFLVHDTCYLENKKLVQASIYQYEGSLNVFDFSEDQKKIEPCLRCLWTKVPDDGCIGTCADVGVLGATAGVLGSLQSIEVSKLILGKIFLKNGEGLFVDLTTQDYEKRRWKKNSECPLCGNGDKKISIESAYKISIDLVQDDFIWVDLRTNEEAEAYPFEQSTLIHMPLTEFHVSKLDCKKQYLLICQKGFRSNQLAKALREDGHENYFSLEGGVLDLLSKP
jgi:molybdopterin/thiamine biosynthesis adenylyltransferase/rhodanese-related sulfurtransferase